MRPDSRHEGVVADRQPAPGPIFIGGIERSGKTLVRRALSAHTRVAFSRRANLWTEHFGRHGDLSDPSNYERCVAAALRRTQVASLEPDLDELRREFTTGPRTYADLFRLLHEHHSDRVGRPRWGDQTALVELYTDRVMAAYPGARMIHLIRDPRDRCAAVRDKYGAHRTSVGTTTARWVLSARAGQRFVDRYPEAYLILRYEALVQDPEQTIRELCEFVGEEYDPVAGTPDDGRSLAMTTEHVGEFRRTLDPADQAVIETLAGGLMAELGYEPEMVRGGGRVPLRAAATAWGPALAGYGARTILDRVTFPSKLHDRGWTR